MTRRTIGQAEGAASERFLRSPPSALSNRRMNLARRPPSSPGGVLGVLHGLLGFLRHLEPGHHGAASSTFRIGALLLRVTDAIALAIRILGASVLRTRRRRINAERQLLARSASGLLSPPRSLEILFCG